MANKHSSNFGTLYLIPAPLGDKGLHAIPAYVLEVANKLDHFIVENEKTARRYLKALGYEHPLNDLELFPLNKRTTDDEKVDYLMPLLNGTSVGLISEAGLPCIADPGAMIVRMAHQNNIEVVPLVGPSSIIQALIASGFNGQSFTFNGYIPIKDPARKAQINQLERNAGRATQIFMETPFRNDQLMNDLIKHCRPTTSLCVACDITLPSETIITKTIAEWKGYKKSFNKRPAIFLLSTE